MSTPTPVALDHDPFLRELIARIQRTKDAAALRFLAVNDTHLMVRYGQAALWFKAEGVVALSGSIEPDRNGPYVAALQRVIDAVHKPEVVAPVALDGDSPALSGAGDWNEFLSPKLLWVPLVDPATGQALGGVLLARDPAWGPGDPARLADWFAAWFWAYRALQRPTLLEGLWLLVKKLPGSVRRRPLLWLAGIILFLCIPVRLNVLAPAEIVPVDPVVVRSPLDGVVKELVVAPNQVVTAGQVLLVLDDVALAGRLDVARQSLATARTELRQYEQLSLTEPKARASLAAARGTVDERQAEVTFLEDQLGRTRLKAARAGTVLLDDPTGWAGRPITTGERLMRIADPDAKKEIEVWVSLGDAIPIQDGAEVKLYLSASPLEPVTAQVRYYSHQSSRLPDGTYGYRVRATPVGPVDHRLGLKGTARISASWTPLGYWVFRRPLAAVREFLGL
jgi:hypothetical protein